MKPTYLLLHMSAIGLLSGCSDSEPPRSSQFVSRLDLDAIVRKVEIEGVKLDREYVEGSTEDRQKDSKTSHLTKSTHKVTGETKQIGELIEEVVSELRKQIEEESGYLNDAALLNHDWDSAPLKMTYTLPQSSGTIRISVSEAKATDETRELTIEIDEISD